MARHARADYVPLMIEAARRRLAIGAEVRMSDIAEELGVSTSLVSFYFGSRQGLVDAAWRATFMAFVEDDQQNVAMSAVSQDWDGIRRLVDHIFSAERDEVHLTHVRAAVEAMRNPQLAEIIKDTNETTIGSWISLMEESISAGLGSTPLQPSALARLFVSVPLGVTLVDANLTTEQRDALAEAWWMMIRAVFDPTFEVPFPAN